MLLTSSQIRHLRSLAHPLKPIVRIGNKGLTDHLFAELERALEDHELIKVSIAGVQREERRTMTQELCQVSGAHLVQVIGRISILYRPSKKERISF